MITNPLTGLSARAANCLYNAGLTNRELVLQAFNEGKLTPPNRIRNYGRKVHQEVCAWLGLPDPYAHQPCPHCGQKMKGGAQ